MFAPQTSSYSPLSRMPLGMGLEKLVFCFPDVILTKFL